MAQFPRGPDVAHIVHRTLYALRFDDGPLAGATVRARGTTTGQFLDIAALAVEADDNTNTRAAVKLFDLVGQALESWDLAEEDGTAIPCDPGGLRSLEPPVAMRVVSAFMEAVGGVSAPLPVTSSGGGPSLEDSMPMAHRPASLAS
jgi:hypothetical protein